MGDFVPWREVCHGLLKEIERLQADVKDLYEKQNETRTDLAFMRGKLLVYGAVAGFVVSTAVSIGIKIVWG